MRKSNTQPLKSVIREYIEALGHKRKLKEVSIVSSWEKLMGKMISNHTKQIYIKNKVLYVHLDSSVLRNELMMQKEKVIDHINDYAGDKIVERVVFR
jgi:predicted nucleic acid-binding Zn ribbon protein